MISETDWEQLSAEASDDRRREKRIRLVFPIEVCGFGRKGQFFIEQTATADVSQNGCSFSLKTEVDRGAFVALKLIKRNSAESNTERPLLFEIARMNPIVNGWVLGAKKLQPENPWCIAFPPARQHLTPVA